MMQRIRIANYLGKYIPCKYRQQINYIFLLSISHRGVMEIKWLNCTQIPITVSNMYSLWYIVRMYKPINKNYMSHGGFHRRFSL